MCILHDIPNKQLSFFISIEKMVRTHKLVVETSGPEEASYLVLVVEVKLNCFLVVTLLKVDWICAGMLASFILKAYFFFQVSVKHSQLLSIT